MYYFEFNKSIKLFLRARVKWVVGYIVIRAGVVSLGIHLIDGKFFSNKLINHVLYLYFETARTFRNGGRFKERTVLKYKVISVNF